MKRKLKYLPNSELTYGPKLPNYRTVDGNRYQYNYDLEEWIFSCGPEDC